MDAQVPQVTPFRNKATNPLAPGRGEAGGEKGVQATNSLYFVLVH